MTFTEEAIQVNLAAVRAGVAYVDLRGNYHSDEEMARRKVEAQKLADAGLYDMDTGEYRPHLLTCRCESCQPDW